MSSPLILASASSIRAKLLSDIQIDFQIQPSDVDEKSLVEKDPPTRALRLATCKAQAVAEQKPDTVVIGCDTVVESATGELFEKPTSVADAERMLLSYANSFCFVHTGIAVAHGAKIESCLETSRVNYGPLSKEKIRWWLDSGLWQGKAGGLQVEAEGQLLISTIEGDYSNVMGLPIYQLECLLQRFSRSLLDYRKR